MAKNTISTEQAQKNNVSIKDSQTTIENALKVFSSPSQIAWLLIFLSLGIVLPSLATLILPSCGEGSLQLKGGNFEYQLTKKGSCNSRSEITQN